MLQFSSWEKNKLIHLFSIQSIVFLMSISLPSCRTETSHLALSNHLEALTPILFASQYLYIYIS